MNAILKILLPLPLILSPAFALALTVVEGEISELGNVTLSPYGMVKGTIVYKIGNIIWHPQEIWLVPVGTFPEEYSSTSETLELSNQEKCTTRLYFSNQSGYAFKITSSLINNGSFCALAYNGTYEILTK